MTDDVYALQFSCLVDSKSCNFCKILDGCVIALDDPLLPYFFPHGFGKNSNPNFKKLCTSEKGCRCIWVAILKEEVNPPPITGFPKHFDKLVREFHLAKLSVKLKQAD